MLAIVWCCGEKTTVADATAGLLMAGMRLGLPKAPFFKAGVTSAVVIFAALVVALGRVA